MYGATLCILILGVLCLIADLGRPDAFYYLLLYPTSSLISIGALAVAVDGKFVGGFLRCGVFAGSARAACAVGPKSCGHPRRSWLWHTRECC